MSFDPYHKWLAIPPKDQPANHYRLLGIDLFESDRDVIATAADQRMMLVRSFQAGENARLSQQILNELAVARLCLLDGERKSAYDDRLRLETGSAEGPAAELLPQRPGTAASSVAVRPTARPVAQRTAHGTPRNGWLIWALVAVAGTAVLSGLIYLLRANDPAALPTPTDTGFQTERQQTVHRQPVSDPAPIRASSEPVIPKVQSTTNPRAAAAPSLRLRPVPVQRIEEGTPLRLQVSLDEKPDAEASSIRYALTAGAPLGLSIDRDSGLLTWLPGEEQGPGSYSVGVVATDGINKDETQVALEIAEANEPPKIAPVPLQKVAPGQTLNLALEATDPDLPPQSLRYELLSGPAGVKLDSATGKLAWTPGRDDVGQAFEARVRVTDSAGAATEAVIGLQVSQNLAAAGKTAQGDEAGNRQPVPEAAAARAAMQQVEKLFAAELAKATDPALRVALAEKLVKEADETTDDPAGSYALYRQAIQQARLAGNAEVAMQATDALARRFAVDPLEEKQQLAAELGKTVHGEEAAAQLVAAVLSLVDEAVAQENWEVATTLMKTATMVAPKTRDAEVRKSLTSRGREITALKKIFSGYQQALADLKQSPQDGAAHRNVGAYQALIQGDWDAGLPHLAQGDDAAWADAAKKELQKPTEAPAMNELAERWAALLKSKPSAGPTAKMLETASTARNNLRKHALQWYESALPGLNGLAKRTTEQAIRDLSTVDDGVAKEKKFNPVTFDFGTATSPLEAGAIRVTSQSRYEPKQGHGFVDKLPSSVERNVGSAMRRDQCFGPDMTFVLDLPNGSYDVGVLSGDASYPTAASEIYLEGKPAANTPALAPNQFFEKSFTVTVSDGQLTVRLHCPNPASNAKINGLSVKKGRRN